MMRPFVHRRAATVAALLAALAVVDCAGNRQPEANIARGTASIVEAATALQKGITAATDQRAIDVALGQRLTGYSQIVYDRSGTLRDALVAYHAATTLQLKQGEAAKIQAALVDVGGAVSKMLGERIPDGALAQLSLLVGNVMNAAAQIQAEVAKTLGTNGGTR